MNYKKIMIFGCIILIFLLIGCTQQASPITQYTCSDGRIVSTPDQCNINANNNSTKELAECPFECCESGGQYQPKGCYYWDNNVECKNNVCVREIKEIYEANNQLKYKLKIIDEWTNVAQSKNCRSQKLDIYNSIIFTAKVSFSKNLIQCDGINDFYTIKESILNEKPPQCPPGELCIYNEGTVPSSTSLTKEYVNNMATCNEQLIGDYKKVINGFGSPSPIVSIAEKCEDCDEIFLIHTYCPGDNDYAFGTWYINAKTGEVYE